MICSLARVVHRMLNGSYFFFFFQAEDGIRDFHVTGVQTCALPISRRRRRRSPGSRAGREWPSVRSSAGRGRGSGRGRGRGGGRGGGRRGSRARGGGRRGRSRGGRVQIGRASCRERVLILVVVVELV